MFDNIDPDQLGQLIEAARWVRILVSGALKLRGLRRPAGARDDREEGRDQAERRCEHCGR